MYTNEATEEYVNTLLTEKSNKLKSISNDLPQLKNSINSFLQANNENSIHNLCTFLNDANFITKYNCDSEIAYCIVAACITAKEFNNRSNNILFLRNIHSINEIIEVITTYKFCIINMEFDTKRNEALNYLKNKINNNELSIIALTYFVEYYSLNKINICNYISDFLY